ncbi:hypothetical protein [Bifidobacterium canis]|uniref:hypothetical protein n=1 Tax=Bifidobacterium canis TaxID=2610880 RepID=UPI0012D93F2A|nr:hypothetical protein [Bifidobacterium canis]
MPVGGPGVRAVGRMVAVGGERTPGGGGGGAHGAHAGGRARVATAPALVVAACAHPAHGDQ